MSEGLRLAIVSILALVAGPFIFYGLYNGVPRMVDRYGMEPVLFGGAALFFVVSVGWTVFTLMFAKAKKEPS